jgi:hypothetical protein
MTRGVTGTMHMPRILPAVIPTRWNLWPLYYPTRLISVTHAREIDQAAASGAPAPSNLSADEKLAYERLQFVHQKGIAYGYQMELRPQTLYGIADSPIGLAAYFLDHGARSYALISRVFAGEPAGLTRDDILDDITITWLTKTALSGCSDFGRS